MASRRRRTSKKGGYLKPNLNPRYSSIARKTRANKTMSNKRRSNKSRSNKTGYRTNVLSSSLFGSIMQK